MKEQTKKKLGEMADNLLEYNPWKLFAGIIYGSMFSILFCLIFIGIKEGVFEDYFQIIVAVVLFVLCFEKADRYISNMPTVYLLPGIGIMLHFVLQMLGYNSPIYYISMIVIWIIASITIIYHCVKYVNKILEPYKLVRKDGKPIKKLRRKK